MRSLRVRVTDETLAGLVKEVRKALKDATCTAPFIRTAYGVGYAFCVGSKNGTTRVGVPLDSAAKLASSVSERRLLWC